MCLFPAESPNAKQARLQDRQRYSRQMGDIHVPLFKQPAVHSKMLNFHSILASLEFYTCTSCTSSCMHSEGAHSPSHVVLQETVYKRLLQLAQARPTMPAFTSYY